MALRSILGILVFMCVFVGACAPRELICPERGGDTWYELRSEHFILRTNLDRSEAKKRSRELERMHDALAHVISIVLPSTSAPSDQIEIVHFSHPMQIQEFVGKTTSGFMSRDRGGVFIASSETESGKGRDHLLMHELTHRFLAAQVDTYPRWLTEGLAGFYETLVVEDEKVVVGGLPRGYSRTWFGNSGFLPSLSELREMNAETFYARKGKHGNYFASWRLVHFLANSTTERYQRFRHYTASLVSGVPEGEAWKLSFGGAGDLSAPVRKYRGTRMVGKRSVVYIAPHVGEPEVRKLSDGEVHVLWARMSEFRHNDKDKLGKKNAKRRYQEVVDAKKHDPEYADIAYWDVELADSAERFSRRSELWEYVRAKKVPPRALLTLVQLEFSNLGTASARREKLGALKPIIERLETVAENGQELNTIAWYYALVGNPKAGMDYAERSVRRAPSCAGCLDTYALLLFQSGHPDLALQVQTRAVELYGEIGEIPKAVAERLRQYTNAPSFVE
tara:strand:- start:56943 stop:58460 length:1518 start_codon:yes stop_codon:yes gene_type:complete